MSLAITGARCWKIDSYLKFTWNNAKLSYIFKRLFRISFQELSIVSYKVSVWFGNLILKKVPFSAFQNKYRVLNKYFKSLKFQVAVFKNNRQDLIDESQGIFQLSNIVPDYMYYVFIYIFDSGSKPL